MNTLWM